MKSFTRLAIVAGAAVICLGSPGAARASETVTNPFDFLVPVTLSMFEVSRAVGVVPGSVVASAAMRWDAISNAVLGGLK
ncbi:MAG: hypothetical protein NTY46_02420 [Candidatus Sumerlaeota bacterium]|nr:hypothetical protein [Candidatus Sumerlaeota bacterium]